MQAYCVKYRAKREMKDPKSITIKNGRPVSRGICPVCGTKMFRIGQRFFLLYNLVAQFVQHIELSEQRLLLSD